MIDHNKNYKEATYEEVAQYIDQLLAINPDDLDAEALRNTKIFGQLNRVYIQKSRRLSELMTQLDKLEFKRKRYYNGKETAETYKKEPLTEAILKSEVDNYMGVDPIIVEMRAVVKEEDRIVKFLEDAKGQLRARGFDIKNAFEYRKMQLGI